MLWAELRLLKDYFLQPGPFSKDKRTKDKRLGSTQLSCSVLQEDAPEMHMHRIRDKQKREKDLSV